MTIDCHAHISPPDMVRRFPMPPSLGDVEGMIEDKLALGVRMSLVGSPVGAGVMAPIPGVDNYAQTVDQLKAFHDWLGGTVADHPGHLRALVYANPFGDDAHLTAAARTLANPEFVGFIVNTSVAGRYLDDPRCDGFFALAAEHDVPVMLHAPAWPAAGAGLTDPLLLEGIGRFDDVSTGTACVIFGGWLEKYPGLRLIATAGGGALALLVERLDRAYHAPHWGGGRPGGEGGWPISRPPSSYLRQIWVDTATPSRLALRAALAVFGSDRILFGTDSPPLQNVVADGLRALEEVSPSAEQLRAMCHENAARLFGLPVHTTM
ncbi:amidohydrolase family protein [Actinomadura sp. NPDC047616]|uniref:amidohydrolase family protein n=1 Tax=Actinomadura sp. NPDC047616 TaxID=3155914 RepID=UPI0033C04DD9